jgi:hypothetical protein
MTQGLPLFLWAEACNNAVYLQNQSPHRVVGEMIPEEVFTGQKSPVEHLRMFGCITFSHVPKEKRTKMETTTEKGLLVGYNETSKSYWLYIPALRRVVIWRYVKFEEERACRRLQELEERQPSTSQKQGSQVQGVGTQSSSTGGTGVSGITGSPVVIVQIGSQGSPQVSSSSTSLFSPLVDSSHGTSGSTGTGTVVQSTGSPGSVGQLSGISSLGEAEEDISGKRKPKWL